jgi:hypothetical protein
MLEVMDYLLSVNYKMMTTYEIGNFNNLDKMVEVLIWQICCLKL